MEINKHGNNELDTNRLEPVSITYLGNIVLVSQLNPSLSGYQACAPTSNFVAHRIARLNPTNIYKGVISKIK